MRTLRRTILSLTATVGLLAASELPESRPAIRSRPLFAQAQPKAGGVTVVESKSYVVEAIVVAALFGIALFAVCRSSRRG